MPFLKTNGRIFCFEKNNIYIFSNTRKRNVYAEPSFSVSLIQGTSIFSWFFIVKIEHFHPFFVPSGFGLVTFVLLDESSFVVTFILKFSELISSFNKNDYYFGPRSFELMIVMFLVKCFEILG